MMVLSGAWAAGDVSLLAYLVSCYGLLFLWACIICFSLMFNGYIQSHFPEETDDESTSKLSPIGAVMGFLYASYLHKIDPLQPVLESIHYPKCAVFVIKAIRCGVVGNTSVSHTGPPGSIPGIGIPFFYFSFVYLHGTLICYRYVLASTGLYYALGQVFDRYDPQEVFFWVSGVGMTCCGIFASIHLYLFRFFFIFPLLLVLFYNTQLRCDRLCLVLYPTW